jgi:hypothetical protein
LPSTNGKQDFCSLVCRWSGPDTCRGGWDPCTKSRCLALHSCQSSSQHRMRSDCPLGLSLASGSSLMAAVRPRCRGEGVSPAITGKRGRELTTPAVGLRSRRCVVKPDPITPHGQSSRGAAEGEGRFPTAMSAALFKNSSLYVCSHFFLHFKHKMDCNENIFF